MTHLPLLQHQDDRKKNGFGQCGIVKRLRSFTIQDHVVELLKGQPRKLTYIMTNRLGRKIDRNLICRHLIRFRERYPDTPNFSIDDIKLAWKDHHNQKTTAAQVEKMAAADGIKLLN